MLHFLKHKIVRYALKCSWLTSKQWWDGYLCLSQNVQVRQSKWKRREGNIERDIPWIVSRLAVGQVLSAAAHRAWSAAQKAQRSAVKKSRKGLSYGRRWMKGFVGSGTYLRGLAAHGSHRLCWRRWRMMENNERKWERG